MNNPLFNTDVRELSEDSPIYQYMDLDYFLRLCETQKYYVKRKATFPDKRETNLPIKGLFRIQAVGHNIPEQPLISPINEEEKKKIDEYKKTGQWFTSCWTLRETENYLMWKSYTSKVGVRLQTTIKRFLEAFNDELQNTYELYCNPIQYSSYCMGSTLEECYFWKGTPFSNEEEFRFYFIPKSETEETKHHEGINLPVDITKMIGNITLSPFINHIATNSLKVWLSREYKLNVKLSEICL